MSKAFNIATNLGAYQSAFDSSGDLTTPNITTDSVTTDSISAANLVIPPSTAPESPSQGDIYLDSSDGRLKIYTGTVWKNILSGQDITASGGTQYDYGNYKLHIFTESGIFRPEGLTEVDVMIVGGGGSGGTDNSGGGGAGGLIWLQNLAVSNQDYTILIGGPSADNSNLNTRSNAGNPSSAFGYTALGGGYGATGDAPVGYNGGPGGSGGGGASEGTNGSGGSGTVGQGNNGGDSANGGGGGGGGAGSVGQNGNVRGTQLGGNGGDGLDMSSYFGIEFGENGWFAGGGGGGNENSINNPSSGGMGGGGDSPYDSHTNSTRGQVNTGGGGGGGTYNSSANALGSGGGSGIVIIRYYLY